MPRNNYVYSSSDEETYQPSRSHRKTRSRSSSRHRNRTLMHSSSHSRKNWERGRSRSPSRTRKRKHESRSHSRSNARKRQTDIRSHSRDVYTNKYYRSRTRSPSKARSIRRVLTSPHHPSSHKHDMPSSNHHPKSRSSSSSRHWNKSRTRKRRHETRSRSRSKSVKRQKHSRSLSRDISTDIISIQEHDHLQKQEGVTVTYTLEVIQRILWTTNIAQHQDPYHIPIHVRGKVTNMETLTLRDEVRDHDRDWHPVDDKETFANIDTFLQMMYLRVHYPVRDPLHGIETFIKINTLR